MDRVSGRLGDDGDAAVDGCRAPARERRGGSAMKSPIRETGLPLTLSPLVGGLGAEIGGVELSQSLGDDVVAAIRHALLTHLVVFFRDQSLSPAGLVDFGRRFGTLGRYPFVDGLRDHPEVIEVTKLEHERTNFGGVWHSDTTYLSEPPMGS